MEHSVRGRMSILAITSCMALAMSFTLYGATASDPSPLQDFCVGVTDPKTSVFVNGFYCKNPQNVTANDFLYKGFDKFGDTNNELGFRAMQLNATIFPAINTLGVAMARADFAPGGVNSPHLHPRGSEMFAVVEGTLYAGFVSSNLQVGGNKLYTKVLKKGDVFVFPQGLIHFQLNIGRTNATAMIAFGSQNPGLVTVSNAVFGSRPIIDNAALTKGFQVNDNVIEALRARFSSSGTQSTYI